MELEIKGILVSLGNSELYVIYNVGGHIMEVSVSRGSIVHNIEKIEC